MRSMRLRTSFRISPGCSPGIPAPARRESTGCARSRSPTLSMKAAGEDARFGSAHEAMKIGIDATSWNNWRGFGRFTRSLVRSLVRIDSHNQYVLFFDSGYEKCSGVPETARRVRVATTVPQDEAIGPSSRRSLADMWRMTRAVAAEGLDLFFSPSVDSYFPVVNVPRKVLAI